MSRVPLFSLLLVACLGAEAFTEELAEEACAAGCTDIEAVGVPHLACWTGEDPGCVPASLFCGGDVATWEDGWDVEGLAYDRKAARECLAGPMGCDDGGVLLPSACGDVFVEDPDAEEEFCDCSSVYKDCTITYDGAGRPTEHCTCTPSCCC